MTEINSNENSNLTVLETAQPLSRSLLWKLQREFFRQKSTGAWGEGIVPSYITSNPFTAGAYARVVSGYLLDLLRNGKINPDQPVYMMELGTGSGCFAYRFLERFLEIYRHSLFKDITVKYIATDFIEENLDFIMNHFKMQDYIETGILDTACFDVQHPAPLKLRHNNKTLGPGQLKNPVIILANYFFDSIPQDDFYIENNKLNEVLYTLRTSVPHPDPDDPALLPHIEKSTTIREVQPTHYYDDPDLGALLEYYCQNLDDTVLQFPCTALECLQYLRRLSSHRLLLLSGDKGYIREQDLAHREFTGFRMHGSFSLKVNYHAIGQYIEQAGGRVLHTSHPDASFKVCAFLLDNTTDDWVETHQAFMEAIEHGGPDDFFRVKKGLEKDFSHWTLEQLFGLMRLSGWDSNIFIRCQPRLKELAKNASGKEKKELLRTVNHVWDTHYPIGEDRDLAACIAELLSILALDKEALDYYQLSLRHYGEKAETFYYMGLCCYRLGRREEAEECLRRARKLDPQLQDLCDTQITLQEKNCRLEQPASHLDMINKEDTGMNIPESIERSGSVLAAELDWLRTVLEARFLNYFQEKGAAADPLKIPPPELGEDDCPYVRLVNRCNLSPAERLVLMLALAPDIKPEVLDVFFSLNKESDRGYSEFGGVCGNRHSGFIPTIETAYFLLSGGSIPLRLYYARFFDNNHTFRRFNILDLDYGDNSEPMAGTPLRLDKDVLDMLITGIMPNNKTSVEPRAEQLNTGAAPEDLVFSPQTPQRSEQPGEPGTARIG